jgi:glycosyltransferase involved in cell wall biosynthesis
VPVRGSTSSDTDSDSAPLLTVIIPSYCGERWIGGCLNSLARDARETIEVLIIDSSPTSATSDLASTYMDRLRLRIVRCRDLESWQAKTNFGVRISQSNHLCWLGVDDLWLPGRAAAVLQWIATFPESPLQFAASAIIDRNGRRLGVWRCPLQPNIPLCSTQVTERLLVQNFVAASAPIFRRDAWLECDGLDEKLWYTADWDLWLKMAALSPIIYRDIITVGFRIHDQSLTSTGSRDLADMGHQMSVVLDRHLPKLGSGSRAVRSVARASIAVNLAMASASAASFWSIARATTKVLRLGPCGIHRYLRDSRILERLAPRILARLAGSI